MRHLSLSFHSISFSCEKRVERILQELKPFYPGFHSISFSCEKRGILKERLHHKSLETVSIQLVSLARREITYIGSKCKIKPLKFPFNQFLLREESFSRRLKQSLISAGFPFNQFLLREERGRQKINLFGGFGVSIQLVSLARREHFRRNKQSYFQLRVSIQLVSLARREFKCQICRIQGHSNEVSIQLVSLARRELALSLKTKRRLIGLVSIQLVSLARRESVSTAGIATSFAFPFNQFLLREERKGIFRVCR